MRNSYIVLIDFGAVKQIVSGQEQGTIIGTANYMPSEQMRGKISLGCDIYAVGLIAIEALTGRSVQDLCNTNAGQLNWLDQTVHINQKLKNILLKMTAYNYTERYANATEAIAAINEKPIEKITKTIFSPTTIQSGSIKIRDGVTKIINKAKNHKHQKLLIGLVTVVGVSVVATGFIIIPYLLATKIEKSPLKIGILWKPESYKTLENYIKSATVPANFIDYLKGKKIEVIVDGDKTLSYAEAQNRMENKLWDISFSTSPINSIFARQNGYIYAASMFPKSTGYQSGLFVKKGSSIKSLNDINSKTIVALGGPNSASSFYMPAYDLYGKTITATIGHRGQEIVKLVKNGQVDVGAAAIGDSIRKDDPDLDIIHVSRDIPGSGVYLSPGLSKSDQENIKKLLLSAPEKIKDDANYGKAKEPDYTEFEKITERVEEILICSDFTKDPVTLGCSKNAKIIIIEGKINGVSNEDNQTILKISDNNGGVHDVSIPLSIAQKVFGSNKLTDIQGKLIRIAAKNVKINNKLMTNEQTQIKLLNKNQ